MLRRSGLTAGESLREQHLIQLVRLRGIDSGQGRPAHSTHAQGVALSGLSREVAGHIPKAVLPAAGRCDRTTERWPWPQTESSASSCAVCDQTVAELAEAMMLIGQRLKLMSLPAQAGQDEFQHLREHRIMMSHGLNLLVVTGGCHTSIVTTH